MPTITIEPATSDRFEDVQTAFSGGGDGLGCQCQWWTLRNVEWAGTTVDERAELLREETAASTPPGLVAYVDGDAAGWIRVGPRTGFARLAHSRVIAPHSPSPWDDPTVWAVNCFVIRKEHRREGLTDRLLSSAIDFARAQGARVLEAYPIDTDAAHRRANDLYTGILSVFTGAGFREVARPKAYQAIVELDLTA
jgi:GNAT superfamily N-acetyltransferase